METVQVVSIIPTKVWIESDMMGARHVMRQHEGYEPFCYATFHYDYTHTSNSQTWADAVHVAKDLGATEPVENRHRGLRVPSDDEIRAQISGLQEFLKGREAKKGQP